MRDVQLEITAPDMLPERLPPRIEVRDDGIATVGPHALLERGTEVELTLEELQWLRDTGLPAAISKLTEILATTQPEAGDGA